MLACSHQKYALGPDAAHWCERLSVGLLDVALDDELSLESLARLLLEVEAGADEFLSLRLTGDGHQVVCNPHAPAQALVALGASSDILAGLLLIRRHVPHTLRLLVDRA